jgi:hypothetical protein
MEMIGWLHAPATSSLKKEPGTSLIHFPIASSPAVSGYENEHCRNEKNHIFIGYLLHIMFMLFYFSNYRYI